jgi:hypothetical protein
MTNLDKLSNASRSEHVGAAHAVFLLVVESPTSIRGMKLPLRVGGSVLGRDADLVVPDATVSRRHARTWWHDGSLWLEDCGSQNGTLVNGRPVKSAVRLRSGDLVTFGSVECRVAPADHGVVRGWAATRPETGAARSGAPTQPLAPAQTETTRYLCAAPHLDEAFGDQVILHTVDQSYRAAAPSVGVDVPAVARHALAARRRRFIRDVLLLVVLIGAAATAAVELTNRENLKMLGTVDKAAVRSLISTMLPPLLVLSGLVVLVVAGESWVARFLVLSRTLSLRRYRPNAVRAPISSGAQRRLDRITATEHANVTIFRHSHPFVGSGLPVNSWSFAIDISKGTSGPGDPKGLRPKEFDVADLHDYLSDALHGLALPGLVVTPRVFVGGGDVWQDRRLLPHPSGPPSASVPPSVVRDMMRETNPIGRPYLCAEATGWHGQLVQTTFLRAVRLRGSLYLEGAEYVLLPLRHRFYEVDSLVPCGPFEAAAAAFGEAVVHGLPLLLASPVRVARAINSMSRAARTEERQRRIVNNGWHFDFGAATNIREIAAGTDTRRYFLEADKSMFETVIQERMLRGVIDFLSDHNIDVGEAKNFQQTINNGNVFNGHFDFRNSNNASISRTTSDTTSSLKTSSNR